MTEIIYVNSVLNVFGLYQVMYQPIPFQPSAIEGYIVPDLNYLIGKIHFRSSPHLRSRSLGELPSFHLLFDADYIQGHYTPETGRITIYLSHPPDLNYYWYIVISGNATKVPWMKEGF